ncbi:MAG: hypothetical protein AAB865_02895 [Patescibacteria group bacterium]
MATGEHVKVFSALGSNPEEVAKRAAKEAEDWLKLQEAAWRASPSNGWIDVQALIPTCTAIGDSSGGIIWFVIFTLRYVGMYRD